MLYISWTCYEQPFYVARAVETLDKVVNFLDTMYALDLYEHTTRQKYLASNIHSEIIEICATALKYKETLDD